VKTHGCTLTQWKGMDVGGMAGFPWMSTVECEEGAEYHAAGVNLHGHLRIYLYQGAMEVNNHTIDIIGGAYWVDAGRRLEVTIRGSAYIVGAHFSLAEVPEAFFSSSYNASSERAYDVRDALAHDGNGTNGAAIQHDPHICNGTTNAKDITWSKHSVVDPPSIAVLNCAPEGQDVPIYGTGSGFNSYVWYHTHPQGAVYLPYSGGCLPSFKFEFKSESGVSLFLRFVWAGGICFQTDSLACIEPGTARWTSPNLFYIEFFKKLNTTENHQVGQ
jgi:hypothetical protein